MPAAHRRGCHPPPRHYIGHWGHTHGQVVVAQAEFVCPRGCHFSHPRRRQPPAAAIRHTPIIPQRQPQAAAPAPEDPYSAHSRGGGCRRYRLAGQLAGGQ